MKNVAMTDIPVVFRASYVGPDLDFATAMANDLEQEDERLEVATCAEATEVLAHLTEMSVDCVVNEKTLPVRAAERLSGRSPRHTAGIATRPTAGRQGRGLKLQVSTMPIRSRAGSAGPSMGLSPFPCCYARSAASLKLIPCVGRLLVINVESNKRNYLHGRAFR